LAEEAGNRVLVLNLGNLQRMASAMVGQLLLLHRRLRKQGGRLILCQVPSSLLEIFCLLRLTQVWTIFTREQEALQTAEEGPWTAWWRRWRYRWA
jgi:anti-anti-sigma factor